MLVCNLKHSMIIPGDSSRVAVGFERVFLINYERLDVFRSCRKGSEKSDNELKRHQQ